MSLKSQRCYHHINREAAARCPECGHFYCRECVVDHEDRLLCNDCLRAATAKADKRNRGMVVVALQMAAALSGLFVTYLLFYLLGESLLRIPSAFHEGEIWTNLVEESVEGL